MYDDELSYYEVICKCVEYINNLIENDKAISNDVEQLKQEMKKVQEWINNYDTSFAEVLLESILQL